MFLLAQPTLASPGCCEFVFDKIVKDHLTELDHQAQCFDAKVSTSRELVLVPRSGCDASYPLVVHFLSRTHPVGTFSVRLSWVEDEESLTMAQIATLDRALAKARELFGETLERLKRPSCSREGDPNYCDRIAERIEAALSSIDSPTLSWSAVERKGGLLDVYFEIDYKHIPLAWVTDDRHLVMMRLPELGIDPVTVEWR
jgi:hypothetical protein